MSMNRNPEWGAGENGKFAAAVVRRELMPSKSWWISASREDFQQKHKDELRRITSVTTPYSPAGATE